MVTIFVVINDFFVCTATKSAWKHSHNVDEIDLEVFHGTPKKKNLKVLNEIHT